MTTKPLYPVSSKFEQYARPEAIVDTQWVTDHLNDPSIRIIESNEDILLFDTGHIPGAAHIDWRRDLQDDLIRDYITPAKFAETCQKYGIKPETKCIFYGDKSNWWACYAFWVFKLFGHKNCTVMDGGRDKWIAEGRELTRTPSKFNSTLYSIPAQRLDSEIRAFFDDTLAHSKARKPLVDVRSGPEFSGERTHMPEYPQEGVLRGGHVPGAKHCPWARAANEDKTFKSVKDLKSIYENELGLKPNDDIIAYCRIGERSSHTWFVLTYLLGYKNVRNYDGSWTEWGNRVRSPIEKNT